jgi:hypothetical protein
LIILAYLIISKVEVNVIMKKFIAVILIMMIVVTLCGTAMAADPAAPAGGDGGGAGLLVFKDAFLGAALGGVIGLTIYLIDDTNFQSKLGIGILLGLVGGIYYGIVETKGVVEIEEDGIKLAQPSLIIKRSNNETIFGATLVKVNL